MNDAVPMWGGFFVFFSIFFGGHNDGLYYLFSDSEGTLKRSPMAT